MIIGIESRCFEHSKTLYFKILHRFILQIVFRRKFVTIFVTFSQTNTTKCLQVRHKSKEVKAKESQPLLSNSDFFVFLQTKTVYIHKNISYGI